MSRANRTLGLEPSDGQNVRFLELQNFWVVPEEADRVQTHKGFDFCVEELLVHGLKVYSFRGYFSLH